MCQTRNSSMTCMSTMLSCLLITALIPDYTLGLKDVSVTVPTAVRRGDNAILICNYDMEGDTLYSVKWYKGRREFYRYTPKENPAMKTFPGQGINVERSLSNQSHVLLTSLQLSNSGKFSCEVSADAPSFHTVIVSGDMEVVELPEHKPQVTGIHSRYRIGDNIRGNCSTDFSKPPANLTWKVNDIQAMPMYIKTYPTMKNSINNTLESSIAEINFIITPQHFIRGRLKIKCIARIHGIYEQEVEKMIEEDRPRILASGRSPSDVNLHPFDQQADGEFLDQNELYLTHYKDMASSASSSSITSARRRRQIRQWDFEDDDDDDGDHHQHHVPHAENSDDSEENSNWSMRNSYRSTSSSRIVLKTKTEIQDNIKGSSKEKYIKMSTIFTTFDVIFYCTLLLIILTSDLQNHLKSFIIGLRIIIASTMEKGKFFSSNEGDTLKTEELKEEDDMKIIDDDNDAGVSVIVKNQNAKRMNKIKINSSL